jgi:hypothetical protein
LGLAFHRDKGYPNIQLLADSAPERTNPTKRKARPRLNGWNPLRGGNGRSSNRGDGGTEGDDHRTKKRMNWARKRSAAAPPSPASERPRELMKESTLCTFSSSSSASIVAAAPPDSVPLRVPQAGLCGRIFFMEEWRKEWICRRGRTEEERRWAWAATVLGIDI